MFPNDLKNAIASTDMELSCCIIGPRDDYEKHSYGDIGIVLGLKNKHSLVAADVNDCGSSEETDGEGHIRRTVRKDKLEDLSLEDLEATLTERTSYNEWIVKDYEVLGLFAHPPCIADDKIYNPQLLHELFPSLPLFSFKDGALYRFVPKPPGAIKHSEIYTKGKPDSE